MLRCVLLLAFGGTLAVAPDTRLIGFVEAAAGENGWTVLVAPGVEDVKLGAGFRHEVPEGREFDTVRAVLAFYECEFRRLRGSDVCLVLPARDTRGFIIREPTPREITLSCVLLDAGGRTTLDLRVRSDFKPGALPEATRLRLLASLEGIHAGGRRTAARLLGVFGPLDAEVVWALQAAHDDEDPAVREAARQALAR